MKILVDRLCETPTPFEFEAGPDWWKERAASDLEPFREVVEPYRMAGEASAMVGAAQGMGSDLLVSGAIAGAIEAECSRCVARYRHALRDDFRLVLEPAGDRVPGDPESARALERDGVWVSEELQTGWYRGSEIDLESFFAELVALALPIQPLCREDCAGLCSRCGIDLNKSTCACAETKPDSPFAVLAALRGGREEGEA